MSAPRFVIRGPVLLGMLALLAMLGGLVAWSLGASIAGAVLASGQVEVEANRQVVQHPEGGVVGQILVSEGDVVAAGDVLLRLDDTQMRLRLNVIESQLYEVLARRDRLRAERDAAPEVIFSDELHDARASNATVAELIDGQRSLFAARRESVAGETAQMRERQRQIGLQIDGAEATLRALGTQIDLLSRDLETQQSLLEQGLTQAANVSNLLREIARLEGQTGETLALIAENRGRIAGLEIDILRLEARIREEAITTLRDLQYTEIELRENRLSLLETLSRMDVRAPRGGIVLGLSVHAERAVIRPAEAILYIVPQDSPLVITARIPAIAIDQVRIGQGAVLRFSAFDQRNTPEIGAQVVKLSPDVLIDQTTGASFYRAELLPSAGEMARLGGRELLPGMPVEVFIATGERSPISYLTKPLTDYFARAFREG